MTCYDKRRVGVIPCLSREKLSRNAGSEAKGDTRDTLSSEEGITVFPSVYGGGDTYVTYIR